MSARTPDFRLYCITDRMICGGEEALLNHVEALCRRGARCVQLREKDLSARSLYLLACTLREITKKYGTLLLINDRADIAIAAGADGVHCREDSMPAGEIRKLNNRLLIGQSVHSGEGATRSVREGVDFLLFGPVYEPGSKSGNNTPVGIDALKQICDSVPIPVYAVGGISPSNTADCLAAGARGVAGVSSVMNPGAEVKVIPEYERILGNL